MLCEEPETLEYRPVVKLLSVIDQQVVIAIGEFQVDGQAIRHMLNPAAPSGMVFPLDLKIGVK
ncbi:MAG: hypothetical protein ACRESZ_07365 [Methylococcales bacterium]